MRARGERGHARWRTRVWARRSSVDHRIAMSGSAIPTTRRRPIHPAWESISRRSPARAAAPRVDVCLMSESDDREAIEWGPLRIRRRVAFLTSGTDPGGISGTAQASSAVHARARDVAELARGAALAVGDCMRWIVTFLLCTQAFACSI